MHDTAVGNRKKHPYPTVVMKPNQIIKFKDSNVIECIERVISHVGKATGKYKSCYNIEYQSQGTKTWINVSVHHVEVINSATENNERNQTSNENKIIEEHKKMKLRRFL